MKFTITVLATLVAVVCARPQESATPTAELTPQATCLANCPIEDVNCKAACVGVPYPASSQAVNTNECAAKCDQGDGTPEATEAFSECVQTCINQNFFPISGATVPTAAPSSGSNESGEAQTTGASPSGGAQESQASDAAAPTGTGAAMSSNQINAAAGFAGLFMALFAL